MSQDLAFAMLAGLSVATYSIFMKLASPGIHPALGATIVTGVAFLANLSLMLSARAAGAPISLTRQSLYFVISWVWPPPPRTSSRCRPTRAACG